MRYLVFRLYAPLVSWGEIAVGGERHTATHPSKSAIIGLIGSALGVKRSDDKKHEELEKGIGLGVKLISQGQILKDYHTTQVPKSSGKIVYRTRKAELELAPENVGTILSSREYRTEAYSIVALWIKGQPSFSLETIKQALSHPTYHLYLGRKSCPISAPLCQRIEEANTLIDALDQPSFPPINLSAKTFNDGVFQSSYIENSITNPRKGIRYYWEDHDNVGIEPQMQTTRYDSIISRNRWQFSSRNEYTAFKKEED